jgi:choline-glycine betaine transporter
MGVRVSRGSGLWDAVWGVVKCWGLVSCVVWCGVVGCRGSGFF